MAWQKIYDSHFELGLDRDIWNTRYIWPRNQVINNEQQHYVDWVASDDWSPFSIDDGILSITARKTPTILLIESNGQPYQSGLLTSRLKGHSQQYGKMEASIKVPAGQGLWPAFWLLPTFKKWPENITLLPEVDVMEVLGHTPHIAHQTVHVNNSAQGGMKQYGQTQEFPESLADQFHTYGVEWDTEMMRFTIDGDLNYEQLMPIDHHGPKHFLLNLAVGGSWPGNPDETTRFPASMQIQWVRGWKKVTDQIINRPSLRLAESDATLAWDAIDNGWKINVYLDGVWFDTIEDPQAVEYSTRLSGRYEIEYLGSEFEFWGRSNSITI